MKESPMLKFLRWYGHNMGRDCPPTGRGTPVTEVMLERYRQCTSSCIDATDFIRQLRGLLKQGGATDADVQTKAARYEGLSKPAKCMSALHINKLCAVVRTLSGTPRDHFTDCSCLDKQIEAQEVLAQQVAREVVKNLEGCCLLDKESF